MAVIGLWVAIVGYGLAYSGARTLGGAQCSLIDAFRGKCATATKTSSNTVPMPGTTLLAQQQAQQRQQAGLIGTQPISQVA